MSIKKLEPRAVWEYFDRITQVPRPSHQEEAIQEFILEEAKRLNLQVERDEAGNIRVVKTSGPRKGVILQAHLDMVPQKNDNKVHDFNKDPITTVIKGDWVHADGTTLGADNGLGVAMILAILADNSLEHPPLEALFTASEETGMYGAKGLRAHWLTGDYLINIDYEDEAELCIGCAGGLDGTYKIPITHETLNKPLYRATIKGLQGGHSGIDIHKNRPNAIKLLARYLEAINVDAIANLKGGNLRNAIPREAIGEFSSALSLEEMNAQAVELMKLFSAAGLEISVEKIADSASYIVETAKILQLLRAFPNGVDIARDGAVICSSNLASVGIEDDVLKINCLLRASTYADRWDLANRLQAFASLSGGSSEYTGDYNGWLSSSDTNLVRLFERTGAEIYGKEPTIEIVHAGLECGILSTNYPHWEMVAFGPTILGAHSPDERVNIASVERSYKWLLSALKELAKS